MKLLSRRPQRLLQDALLISAVSVTTTSVADPLDIELGHQLFEKLWVPAPASTQSSDGLGPLFNARSCESCHVNGGRGSTLSASGSPSAARVVKVGTRPSEGQVRLMMDGLLKSPADTQLGTQIQTRSVPGLAGEASLTIDQHSLVVSDHLLSYPSVDVVTTGAHRPERVSIRLAPQLYGLGLLGLIPESQILVNSDPADLNQDGISGRINWISDDGQLKVGRFGWKSSEPTLKRQTASAFNVDLGLGNSLYPNPYGDCQPSQHTCLSLANGNSPTATDPEVGNLVLELVTTYIAILEPQSSREPDALFYRVGCAECHIPEYVLQSQDLSRIIRPYTDLLLHDLGEELADDLQEYQATGSEWRTAPLWGLSTNYFDKGHTGYLHDGRAATLTEAILWHGGEASSSRDLFLQLGDQDRDRLVRFLEAL